MHEIIKALEHLQNETNCQECVLYKFCNTHKGKCVFTQVLNLINRQKEEIDRLQEIITMAEFTSYTAVRAKQDWHRRNSEYIDRLKEENERLKEKVDFVENLDSIRSEIKAEIVKEFVKGLAIKL